MKITVLCLTYGEPEENKWLPQFQYSWSILNRLTRRVAPIPRFVTPMLAARRGLIRASTFRKLGWQSPLENYSRLQVDAIRANLEKARPDVDWDVRLVFEFRAPYLSTVLQTLVVDPPDEIVIVPLYVADSDFTSGVSRTDLENFDKSIRRRAGANPLPAPRYLEGFGFDERAGKVFANFIWAEVQKAGWSPEKCRESVLILGAHGTLIFPPPGVNNGAKETRTMFGLIRKHLKDRFADLRIGWLNHTIGGVWTFPEVADSARESQDRGIKNVVYFPFGFTADNGETQLEGKIQLGEFEWNDMLYLLCPNDDPAYVDLMAQRVLERLDGPPTQWEGIGKGDPALTRREPTPRAGQPGLGRFSAPILAAVAFLFWLVLGSMLFARGVDSLLKIDSPVTQTLLVGLAIFLGVYKGWDILAPVAKQNLLRLRRLPQPGPLWQVFSKATWIIIAVMMLLGVSLRIFPLPDGVRATILIAVGIGMLMGAANYLRLFRLVRPLDKTNTKPVHLHVPIAGGAAK